MTLGACLKKFGTGGLRRLPNGNPFEDVLQSERTPKCERSLFPHPNIKPQSLMRSLVYSSLPLGEGTVLDPFMGSGSTIAACNYLGYEGVGIEKDQKYYKQSLSAIKALQSISADSDQLLLALA